MKAETKRIIRRFTLRWLRKLWDAVDERLHAAEIQFQIEGGLQVKPAPAESLSPQKRESHAPRTETRNCNPAPRAARYPDDAAADSQLEQFAAGSASAAASNAERLAPHRHRQTYAEWEAQRELAPRSKREARQASTRTRRRLTADAFDLQFQRSAR